ncbi:MAG: hypothetical protein J5846_02010 [Desulfovibrio sp.]|nr:hypothetical protein [Desulfovibrio sp.]
MEPFTLHLVGRRVEDSSVDGVFIKVDPGSKEIGLATVRKKGWNVYAL